MKYDKKATGMIDISDIKSFVLDLTVEELILYEEKENKSEKPQILFNFYQNKAITLYTKWQRDMIDDSPEFD